jgi:hypothetical protein
LEVVETGDAVLLRPKRAQDQQVDELVRIAIEDFMAETPPMKTAGD